MAPTAAGRRATPAMSASSGYLSGVGSPFAEAFHAMAGQAWVDWAFMLGLALVGDAQRRRRRGGCLCGRSRRVS